MVHKRKSLKEFLKEEEKDYMNLGGLNTAYTKNEAEKMQKILKHEKIPTRLKKSWIPYFWNVQVMEKNAQRAYKILDNFESLSYERQERFLKSIR